MLLILKNGCDENFAVKRPLITNLSPKLITPQHLVIHEVFFPERKKRIISQSTEYNHLHYVEYLLRVENYGFVNIKT